MTYEILSSGDRIYCSAPMASGVGDARSLYQLDRIEAMGWRLSADDASKWSTMAVAPGAGQTKPEAMRITGR
jgi:hypothetical protein